MDSHCKVAVITGGGRGIGKAVAKRLLQAGIKVVIGEINSETGERTARGLQDLGEITFIQTDVRDEESVQRMVQETIARHQHLDYLVNNAAIANPINRPLIELTLEEWNKVVATNLTGAFLCAKYCAPYLAKRRGAIVNIASTRALMSEPNTEAYSACKGGIIALTHAMAMSLGPEVRVNCISPGWINVSGELSDADHRQHPVGRVGEPKDIASMTAFLLSSEASFITGANFVVDGGMTRKMIYL